MCLTPTSTAPVTSTRVGHVIERRAWSLTRTKMAAVKCCLLLFAMGLLVALSQAKKKGVSKEVIICS